MFNYECDYGPENGETHSKPNVEHPQVISRINAELFCERKGLGIRHGSAAFCDHRRDLGLADCRCGRCAERVSPAHSCLSDTKEACRLRQKCYQAFDFPMSANAVPAAASANAVPMI